MVQLMNVINVLLLPRNVRFVKRIILMKTIPELNVHIATIIMTQSPYNFASVFSLRDIWHFILRLSPSTAVE